MKTIITIVSAAFLVTSFGVGVQAATPSARANTAQIRKDCKAQAARKYTAVHFIKRNRFVSACMNEHRAKKI